MDLDHKNQGQKTHNLYEDAIKRQQSAIEAVIKNLLIEMGYKFKSEAEFTKFIEKRCEVFHSPSDEDRKILNIDNTPTLEYWWKADIHFGDKDFKYIDCLGIKLLNSV